MTEEHISSKTVDVVEEEYKRSTPEANVDRWINFLDSFQITKTKNEAETKQRPYLSQIKSLSAATPYIYSQHTDAESHEDIGRTLFVLDYQDLVHSRSDLFGLFTSEKYKKKEDKERRILSIKVLCYQIHNHWDEAKACIKKAIWALLEIHDKGYQDILGSPDKLVIVVHNFEITKPIIDISSKDLDKFRRIEVLIPQFDDQPSIELLGIRFRCIKCNEVTPPLPTRKAPKKCLNCEHADTYVEDPSLKLVRDFMYFNAQDTSDKMRLGQSIANSMNVSVSEMPFVRSIYNAIEVGSYAALNGIIRLAEGQRGSTKSNAEFECVGIEILSEKNKQNNKVRTLVEREIPPDQMDEHYEKLIKSYAPHLQGLKTPKEILLLHAASGNSLQEKSGSSRLRGRSNTLLLGDSNQGKSELLNFHVRLHKRSVKALGSQASRVGITASIKKLETIRGGEKITRQSIDPGPYGICRGGDVCVDEWDKVASKEIYEAVASAMDDYQSLPIHKNAAHTEIQVDCGSLHVANPITGNGKYDTSLSVLKQTNFANWLWSRYDFKVLFLSSRTDESRHMLWEHKAKMMENMITEQDYRNRSYEQYLKDSINELEEDVYSFDYLYHELAYVREKYPDPVLKPNSMPWIMMMKFWNKWNKISIIPESDIQENGEKAPFVPAVDERSINAMQRAAKASARLHRRNEVTATDMNIVMNLMRKTIKAFVPHISLEAELERESDRAELMINETIRQAILFNTKELNDKIVKFYYAFIKVLRKLHQDYFKRCDVCHGKGFISEKAGIEPTSKDDICTACHNQKGEYVKISFAEFDKCCIDTGTSYYCNDFFKMMKDINFLYKDKEAITTTVYYRVPKGVILTSANMIKKVNQAINTMFGLDEYAIAAQRKLLVNAQRTK